MSMMAIRSGRGSESGRKALPRSKTTGPSAGVASPSTSGASFSILEATACSDGMRRPRVLLLGPVTLVTDLMRRLGWPDEEDGCAGRS